MNKRIRAAEKLEEAARMLRDENVDASDALRKVDSANRILYSVRVSETDYLYDGFQG